MINYRWRRREQLHKSKLKRNRLRFLKRRFRCFVEIAELLILSGANVNCTNSIKNTPLHLACLYGHFEVTKILLQNDVSMTKKNITGKTALDIAKDKNHKKIYRMIYEKMVSTLSTSENQIENVEEHREIKRMIFDKLEYSPEQKNCVVCYDPRNGTFVLQPCGHAKTCETCSLKIVNESKICPMCRGHVTKYQKIFD